MNQEQEKNEQALLEQSLLEMHYGLLDDTEANDLRAKIETDPTVAKLWAQTLGMAGQFADAAKLAGAKDLDQLPMPKMKPEKDVDWDPLKSQDIDRKPETKAEFADRIFQRNRRIHGRIMKAIVAMAALVFLAVTLGYFASFPVSPASAIRIDVEAVSSNNNSRNTFEVLTQQMANQATSSLRTVSANLLVTIQVAGATVHTDRITTNQSGQILYSVPATLKLPKDATLTVRVPNDRFAQKAVTVPLEPTRCLTYLNVDKPVYMPGETIRFRSLSLERFSLQPNVDLPIRFEMLDPSGAVVNGASADGVTDRGVGNGEFKIPVSAPGGQYTLVAKSLDGFFPDEKRSVQIRDFRVPRFKKDLEFKRRSYGPGETVEADFEAIRAEGGPLANQSIKVTATVDGRVVHNEETKTSKSGTCAISFKLPEHITKGSGSLSVSVDDGGTQEVQSKSIPIQLGTVKVDFYPEGGYLINGLANRVYFSARNPLGKPIHIAGEVLDRSGKQVAKLETTRDGMGRFEFTPRMGELYSLKIADPIDVTNSPKLPQVVTRLPVMSTGTGVFANNENIKFKIQASHRRQVEIQAVCRGSLVAQQQLELKPGTSDLEIDLPPEVEGVVRLTVLDANVKPAIPLVERLVFRELRRKLTVKVDGDPSSLERSPGEPVRLSLSVFDENGDPTPAMLGVTVVDDAVLSLQDGELPQLPTHFLLTSEIEKPEDLEHANFYLSGSDESRESLDLLLGTQGWRRFVSSSLASTESTAAGFSEQLARLVDLDGKQTHLAQFANVQMINNQWRSYSDSVSLNRRRYMLALQWLVLPFLVLLLLVYLCRPRKVRLMGSVGMVVGLMASVAFIGCGVKENATSKAPMMDSAPAIEQGNVPFESDGVASEMELPDDDVDPERFADGENDKRELGGRKPFRQRKIQIVHHNPMNANKQKSGEFFSPNDSSGDSESHSSISKEKLEQLLRSRGINTKDLADQLMNELRFPVREYSHQHVSTEDNVREDFTQTLYWQPLLITDSNGKATIRFDLSDSITTFQVLADAHTSNGRIGTGGGSLVSRIPLQIEPKLPIAVTGGDRIDLPVAVINATNSELPVDLKIKIGDAFEVVGPSNHQMSLKKQGRAREYFSLKVLNGKNESATSIELAGKSGSLTDTVRKAVKVAPSGYPVRESVSGVLDEKVSVMLPIPEGAVPGSLAVSLKAYPSPLADLMSGVESILQEPHGCFEQTSATNYPNTIALQYLETNHITNPATTRRAKSLLDKGYSKLISFECTKKGYEWFGSNPGHEALSAFGLLQFTDMSRVMKIDIEMMARTRAWLLGRRDGNGGFKRNSRHLHVWSVEQETVNAYVVWALTEADLSAGNAQRSASELSRELDQLNKVARGSNDAYLIGLTAASMMNVGREADGKFLLDRLVTLQKESGELDGRTTVTQSGGKSKKVETTAIAILAWAKRSGDYQSAFGKAAKWLVSNRSGNGGFGSTQATVLALKALVAYSEKATVSGAGSVLYLKQDGKTIGQVKLPEDVKNGSVVELNGLGSLLETGNSNIELVAEGVKNLPFAFEVLYHTATPPTDDRCPLELVTKFENNNGQTDSGSTIRVKAVLKNTVDQGQPMTVASIGLPGGVEPRIEQLNELRDAGNFDFYEIRPREVICYWRMISPSEEKVIEFDVTAEIPGKYTGPASKAYLYYTAEQKVWTEPLTMEINK